MKFRPYLILILLFSNLLCSTQNTYVPDDNFEQALIDLGHDFGPLDDYVPTANIAYISNIILQFKGIIDLTGIEDFTGLQSLNCTDNSIQTLDLSGNPNLTILNADRNNLTSINLSKNTKLETLYIGTNLLPNIDISNNPNLKYFFCSSNQITNLTIEHNPNLVFLSCYWNNISSFQIPPNNSLIDLSISGNPLTSLDVSSGTTLKYLEGVENQLQSLDVTNCTNLEGLYLSDNNISSLDLTNNPRLYGFWCENNPITNLDLTSLPDLNILRFGGTLLREIDLTNNPKLIRLFGDNTPFLCQMDLRNGNNTALSDFSMKNSPLLSCIFVDSSSYSTSNWQQPGEVYNFIETQAECDAIQCKDEVDVLEDVSECENYVLPTLNNGAYFTDQDGSGTQRFPGDRITTTQTLYVYQDSECNTNCLNQSSFRVTIGCAFIPKYFTPNGDGTHDFWQIKRDFNLVKSITIFDRYGKLLKTMSPYSNGWDGTFNEKPLIVNDYWYQIEYHSGKIINGHFTLKR